MNKAYKILILCILFTSAMNYLLAQGVPVIGTRIGRSFSFSNDELMRSLKDFELYNKYSEAYCDETLREALSPNIRKQLEDLFERNEGGDFWQDNWVWATQDDGCSWYCGGSHVQTASSSLSDIGTNSYTPDLVFDGDVRTAWVEGVEGYGIGEFINVHFPAKGPQATVCYIVNGYNKDEQTWRNNSRVKSFNLYLDDKLLAKVHLQDSRDEQYFLLPDTLPNRVDTTLYKRIQFMDESIKVSTLRFEIIEVYKGDLYEDTAISEIWFDGIGVHCLAGETVIKTSGNQTTRMDEIRKGDQIVVYNLITKKYINQEVQSVHRASHHEVYTLSLSNGEELTITEDHPLLSSSGWVSLNPAKTKRYKSYVDEEVKLLTVGGEILGRNGTEVTVVSLRVKKEKQLMYSLEFADNPIAFEANGVLVGQE